MPNITIELTHEEATVVEAALDAYEDYLCAEDTPETAETLDSIETVIGKLIAFRNAHT